MGTDSERAGFLDREGNTGAAKGMLAFEIKKEDNGRERR